MTAERDTAPHRPLGHVVGAAAWSVVMQTGLRVVQLVAFLALARLLNPAAFGTFALALAVISVLEIVVGLGLTEAIAQRHELSERELRSAHWVSVLVGLGLTALVLVVCLPLWIGADGLLPGTLCVLAPMLLVRSLRTVPEAVLRRDLDFRPVAQAYVAAAILGAAVALVVAGFDGGPWALVAQALTTAVVTTALVRHASHWSPARPAERRCAVPLLSFGWKVGAAGLLNAVNKRTDDLFLGAHQSATQVGYYATGYTMSELAESGLSGALGQVAVPAFSAVESDRTRLRERYLRAVEISAVIAFPIFSTLAAFADPAVAVLLGAKWAAAAPVLVVVGTMSMVRSVGHFNAPLLIAVGRADTMLRIMVAQAIASVILFSIAAPFGIVAMAWAVLARVTISLPVTLAAIARHAGVRWTDWLNRIAAPATAAVVATMLARTIVRFAHVPDTAMVELALGASTSMVAFAAIMALVRPGVLRGAVASIVQRPGQEVRS